MAMADAGERSYLRPVGLVQATDRGKATDGGYAGTLPLCCGPFDFSAVEIITRAGRQVHRRLLTLAELWQSDAGPALAGAQDTLARLTSPRRRLAGLPMDRPQIMGVVNVTPDSFSDGGQFGTSEEAVAHGLRLAEAGATLLDIGGESTRPGSAATPLEVELGRVIPVRSSDPARLEQRPSRFVQGNVVVINRG